MLTNAPESINVHFFAWLSWTGSHSHMYLRLSHACYRLRPEQFKVWLCPQGTIAWHSPFELSPTPGGFTVEEELSDLPRRASQRSPVRACGCFSPPQGGTVASHCLLALWGGWGGP